MLLTILDYSRCTTHDIRQVVRNAKRYAKRYANQPSSPHYQKAVRLLPALIALLADREARERVGM